MRINTELQNYCSQDQLEYTNEPYAIAKIATKDLEEAISYIYEIIEERREILIIRIFHSSKNYPKDFK